MGKIVVAVWREYPKTQSVSEGSRGCTHAGGGQGS